MMVTVSSNISYVANIYIKLKIITSKLHNLSIFADVETLSTLIKKLLKSFTNKVHCLMNTIFIYLSVSISIYIYISIDIYVYRYLFHKCLIVELYFLTFKDKKTY